MSDWSSTLTPEPCIRTTAATCAHDRACAGSPARLVDAHGAVSRVYTESSPRWKVLSTAVHRDSDVWLCVRMYSGS